MKLQEFINLPLRNKQDLKNLGIRGESLTSLSDIDFQKFCNTIQDCKNLQTLNIGTTKLENLDENRIRMLCNAISTCKNLKRLDLGDNDFSKLKIKHLQIICDMVSKLTGLERLELSNSNLNELNEENFQKIFTAIYKCETLMIINGIEDLSPERKEKLYTIALKHTEGASLDQDIQIEPKSLTSLTKKFILEANIQDPQNRLPKDLVEPIKRARTFLPKEIFKNPEEKLNRLFFCLENHKFTEFYRILNEDRTVFNINEKNADGKSLLHLASVNNKSGKVPDVRFLKALLEKGANPNIEDAQGWTPFHHAAYEGHLTCIEAYAKHSEVDWKAKTKDNNSAIYSIIDQGKETFPNHAHNYDKISDIVERALNVLFRKPR